MFKDWTEGDPLNLTVEEFDALVASLKLQKAECERLKEEKTRAEDLRSRLESQIIAALKSSGKSKYFVDGIGTVYQINKLVFRTPKTVEDKRALFDYIEREYGKDALDGYLTLNHQTLNSFANQEMERMVEKNPRFTIPGLEAPTGISSLGFRKDKDKEVASG